MTTQEAWNEYANDVKHFIMSKVKNTLAADDILQDTFLKIHTKLHTLNDVTKLKPWIFTTCRNTIIDYFRTTKQTFDASDFDIPVEDKDHSHTEKDCLHGILKKIPKKYRDPLFLSDIKGLKQQEVAKQLNQNLPTTKSQIQRARKLIAKGFMDCCGFELDDHGKLVGEIQEKEDCNVCN